ncbi:hypothetical protein [Paenibacillus silvae]|uniref:hypothetical protein n=2 Tax=Paenibacillus silvae TaxID=1325358 RepID=UPI0011A2E0C2|nr:hypothetical protein [Paenibacillus silvae]
MMLQAGAQLDSITEVGTTWNGNGMVTFSEHYRNVEMGTMLHVQSDTPNVWSNTKQLARLAGYTVNGEAG